MKIFFLHIPKTAGSSINKFFSNNLSSHLFHIEGITGLNKETCDNYEFISGHIPFTTINKLLPLDEWTTIATFRDPLSYVISHISWVRKLADPGEEARFNAHPEPFQKIAKKMTEYDFSNPAHLIDLISWLEGENLLFLHNTQTYFLSGEHNRNTYSDLQVNTALKNLKNIDYIGIQEELNSFMEILSNEFNWPKNNEIKENINSEKYGLDINNKELREALYPLYNKDMIIYKEANEKFKKICK